MNYILDTHVLLWFLRNEDKFSGKARQIILDNTCEKHISIVSLWEIAIKNRIGKLPLANGVSEVFDKIADNGFGLMKIDRKCVEIYNALPLIHRDPFDGMIIATAISRQMTIITADENIQKYDTDWVW